VFWGVHSYLISSTWTLIPRAADGLHSYPFGNRDSRFRLPFIQVVSNSSQKGHHHCLRRSIMYGRGRARPDNPGGVRANPIANHYTNDCVNGRGGGIPAGRVNGLD